MLMVKREECGTWAMDWRSEVKTGSKTIIKNRDKLNLKYMHIFYLKYFQYWMSILFEYNSWIIRGHTGSQAIKMVTHFFTHSFDTLYIAPCPIFFSLQQSRFTLWSLELQCVEVFDLSTFNANFCTELQIMWVFAPIRIHFQKLRIEN